MKLTRILVLSILFLLVTVSANATGYIKFDGIKGESSAPAGKPTPGQVSGTGSITRPTSPPPMNKEEPVKIRNCPPKVSDLPRSTGDEAGTGKGNISGTVVISDCPPVAVDVKLPAPTP